jgi:predicted HTH transcriptional regulator
MENTVKAPITNLDLFGGETVLGLKPRARRTDPSTSHAAAESLGESPKFQREQILRVLRKSPAGLTNDQLDEQFQWRTGTASRRTAELLAAGAIERREGDERKTATGRMAQINRALDVR